MKRKLKKRKKIEQLEAQLAKEKTKTEKYKKRFLRAKKESASKSPRTKVSALLGNQNVKSPIKRALLFHTSLIEDIRKNTKTNKREAIDCESGHWKYS